MVVVHGKYGKRRTNEKLVFLIHIYLVTELLKQQMALPDLVFMVPERTRAYLVNQRLELCQ